TLAELENNLFNATRSIRVIGFEEVKNAHVVPVCTAGDCLMHVHE
ncbi:MAG: hypothetical protein K0R45_381, partial [Pseudomonas sp.]|nr:hypothetical protein [Pseudomonas sp.]